MEGGTAEAFNFAIRRFVKDDNFVGMNCDELTSLNLSNLIDLHESRKPVVTMGLAPFYCRFSVVSFDNDLTINDFQYGKKIQNLPISMGIYVFSKDITKYIPQKGSIEDTTFVSLVKSGRVIGRMLEDGEEWFSINTIKDVKEAETQIKIWKAYR